LTVFSLSDNLKTRKRFIVKRGGEVLVKIRLARFGAHKRPFYRLVVADSRAKRNGPFIEILGTYDPLKEPSEIKINLEKAKSWLQKGAQPTVITKKLLQRAGL
jgi:small subunit ribosomal protein S16